MYARRTGIGSAAAACSLYERVAVCTLGNSRILLVSADVDAAERTVIFSYHIVLALRNGTLNVVVLFLIFHNKTLLTLDLQQLFDCCHDSIMNRTITIIHPPKDYMNLY